MRAPDYRRRTWAGYSAGSNGSPPNRPPAKARPDWDSRSSSGSSTCMGGPSPPTAPGQGKALPSPSRCQRQPCPDMSQNPHIIVVDDEAPAREMVGDYLKMHG